MQPGIGIILRQFGLSLRIACVYKAINKDDKKKGSLHGYCTIWFFVLKYTQRRKLSTIKEKMFYSTFR